MARYKVIQDVEAEDKLLGPLTLRQFIYAFVAGVCIFLCYFVATHGAPFLIVLFVPPAVVAGFFAFPWSHEQSTEVWALARVRFLFKPRVRVWNQSGIKELVTITVPRHLELIYTDGLSQNEVRSRLRALADTIDSRGWAIKNVATTPYAPAYAATSDDRLLGMANLPHEVPSLGQETYVDVLDPTDNHVAQQFDDMLSQSAIQHHQKLVATLQQTATPAAAQSQPQAPPPTSTIQAQQPAPDYWFLNQSQPHDNSATTIVSPGGAQQSTALSQQDATDNPKEEQELVESLRKHAPGPAFEYSHLPTILPLAEREKLAKEEAQKAAEAQKIQELQTTQVKPSTSTMTDKHNAAILDLAGNDDLSIDTLAREAKKSQASDDEVIISLH